MSVAQSLVNLVAGVLNTDSSLKFFGGLSNGSPNAKDIRNAEAFTRNLKGKARG